MFSIMYNIKCLHPLFFFIFEPPYLALQLIVAYRLCVIYVREDNDFNA